MEPNKEHYVLDKKNLGEFLKGLLGSHKVFAPVANERGTVEYGHLNDEKSISRINLECLPQSSPKKVLLPQSEVLLTWKRNGTKVVVEQKAIGAEKLLIFGVKPCDAVAISMMDRLFLEGQYRDPYYAARRENTVIIALACREPASACFCESVGGSPSGKDGADVLFTDIGDRFYIDPVTEKGECFLNDNKGTIKKPDSGDEKLKNAAENDAGKFARKIDIKSVEKLSGLFESDYWAKIARRCLGCGTCTYFCPTCSCFDINDEYGGRRVRTWDSCQFPDFTMHTSGHNPRPDKAKRLRNRFYHKFRYSKDIFGKPFCVGCGRCISLCPAGIDITKVINEVK